MKELEIGILEQLSKEYGDSFYLLDTDQFRRNFMELRGEFRKIYPNSNIAYSYKTNYIPQLGKIVDELGGYAEVVSDMECEIAKSIGVAPEHIAFNGPYKNKAKVEAFLLEGVNVNVDSIYELQHVISVANKYPERGFAIGVRCNFDIGDGVLSRFGFDVEGEDFKNALRMIKETPNLRLKGMHSHFASRSLDTWPVRARKMLEVVETYYEGVPEYICQGGGIFGKMADSLKSQFDSYIPNYKEYAEAVCPLYQEMYGKLPVEQQPTLFIEPGSALVGDCMKFAAKVVSIKNVRGKNIATLLGSIYNINPTLNKKNPPLEVYHAGEYLAEMYEDLDFGGFTCIESDYLYRHYDGKLAVGDYVVFGNAGSYSVVLKPPFILPNFAIVELKDDGEVNLVKRAECFEDLFHTYTF